MAYTTLISVPELALHLDDPDWAVVDCRFSLAEKERGRQDYLSGHIPTAVYAHLDHDLSGPVKPGVTGRHPLPVVEAAACAFSKWGIGPGAQVVAYDAAGGALAAVRLWWMLRWLGHESVAVLDGGWQYWQEGGYPIRAGWEQRDWQTFIPHPPQAGVVSTEEVESIRLDPAYRLFDARTFERYRGENETIDPVAGHIPGAINAPYVENLTPQGDFRPKDELREHYRSLLGDIPAGRAVFYCGSGVTSIHNILAMLHAGLGEAVLYAGSWSEWITDPARPVAKEE